MVGTFQVDATDTFARLKARIQATEGIPTEQQRLIFAKRDLADDRTLTDYNIPSGSTLEDRPCAPPAPRPGAFRGAPPVRLTPVRSAPSRPA